MTLTERDKRILLLLREQGFLSFEQIQKRFFKNKPNTSRRLSELEASHYITSKNAKEYLVGENPQSKIFPYLLGLGISPKTKIYYLNNVFRRQFPETNRLLKKDLCLHQLLLNDTRFHVEDYVLPNLSFNNYNLIINDPDHKILAEIDITKRKEFTPDLTVLSGNISIAIELERTQKGQNRYQERFWYYEDSSYTHVIYYYVNEAHLKNLLSFAGSSNKFVFAHYLKPKEVLSNLFAYMNVNEWINKIIEIERLLPNEPKAKSTRQHDQLFF